MQQPRHGLMVSWLVFLLIFPLAGLLAGCSSNDLSFATEYQAVFLDNGQILFGKMGDVGSDYLSLHDVYYIQRQVEPEKKEARNLLVRLGSEWHAPDFMRINTRHIVFIEPVAPDSRVSQLIRKAKTQPVPSPTATPPAAVAPPAKEPVAAPPAQTPVQTPVPPAKPKPEKRRPAGR